MTTEKGGQPIGKRIRQVCRAIDEGACNSITVAAAANLPSKEVARYALRAGKHGLLTIDRDTWPYTYAIAAGWWRLLDHQRPGRKSRAADMAKVFRRANSVFQWAQQ